MPFPKSVPIVSLALLVAACAEPDEEAPAAAASTQDWPECSSPCEIEISRAGNSDNLRYRVPGQGIEEARRLHLDLSDSVTWTSSDSAPWAVHFRDGRTPFAAPAFRGRGRGNPVVPQDTGRYKYFVALLVEGDTILTDDPEFMID